MPEESEPFDTLCEVYRQLTTGEVRMLHLSTEQRATLREIMEESRGHTTYEIVDDVLTALSGPPEDDVRLSADLAGLLRREIEGSIKQVLEQRNLLGSRALITIPQYVTRMSDLQLCAVVHEQLKRGTSFALPEVEIMQLVDIVNQTAREQPQEKRLFQLGECIRRLSKDATIQAPEPFYRIELGDALAEFLRTNLANAIQYDAGLGSNG